MNESKLVLACQITDRNTVYDLYRKVVKEEKMKVLPFQQMLDRYLVVPLDEQSWGHMSKEDFRVMYKPYGDAKRGGFRVFKHR